MESLERDDLFFLANLMSENDCPEMSIKYLVRAIEISPQLNEDQQNLLVNTYRQISSKLRNALKKFKSIYDTVEVETESQAQAMQVLKQDLSGNLLNVCNDICALINEKLLPNASTPIDQAVYHLVFGDFSRFVGELDIVESEEAASLSQENYLSAKQIAEKVLPLGHPTRLIIDLNYSILLNDVLNEPTQAIELAQNAINSSLNFIDELPTDDLKTMSKDVIDRLKDNVTTWATEALS